MTEDRRLVRLAPLAPRPDALPVLVPDPAWWAAWERWAQASDRLDANPPGWGTPSLIMGYSPAVLQRRLVRAGRLDAPAASAAGGTRSRRPCAAAGPGTRRSPPPGSTGPGAAPPAAAHRSPGRSRGPACCFSHLRCTSFANASASSARVMWWYQPRSLVTS